MDLNRYALDTDKANNGAWIKIDGGGEVLIARMHNRAFKQELKRLQAPYVLPSGKLEIDQEVLDELINKAMAKTILLNWRGITYQGEEFPYSAENSLKICTNPKFEQFKNLVVMLSSDLDNYREEQKAKKLDG